MKHYKHDDEGTGMLDYVSQRGQNFFKKFLWKILYDVRYKNYDDTFDKEILSDFLIEIKKPKLKEVNIGRRKKFEFTRNGKDIFVKIKIN